MLCLKEPLNMRRKVKRAETGGQKAKMVKIWIMLNENSRVP
jgi:hypothetical protein